MKIKTYLKEIYESVKKEEEIIGIYQRMTSNKASAEPLIKIALDLEKLTSIAKLKALLAELAVKNVNQENLQPLKLFLENRWHVIANTPLSYSYTSTDNLTKICLNLAIKLAEVYDIYRFKLLMPTISAANELLSITEIKEDKEDQTSLDEFVLCDNNIHIINVYDSLSYAKEDGVLKHTSVMDFKKMPRQLSEGEMIKVIHHSKESQKIYKVLMDLNEARNKSLAVGHALKRLIRKLRDGGVIAKKKRTGIKNLSDNTTVMFEVYEGIGEFYEYLKTLTESDRRKIFALRCGSREFKYVWYSLLIRACGESMGVITLPNDELKEIADYVTVKILEPKENTPESLLCVQLTADDIDKMVDQNNLMDVFPVGIIDVRTSTILQSEFALGEAQENFTKALAAGTYTVIPPANSSSDDQLTKQKIFKSLWINAKEMNKTLQMVRELHHVELLRNMITTDDLQKIVPDSEALLTLIAGNSSSIPVIMSALTFPYLRNIIRTPEAFKGIINSYGEIFTLINFLHEFGANSIKNLFPDHQSVTDFNKDLSGVAKNALGNVKCIPSHPKPEPLKSLMTSTYHFQLFTKPKVRKDRENDLSVRLLEEKEDLMTDEELEPLIVGNKSSSSMDNGKKARYRK